MRSPVMQMLHSLFIITSQVEHTNDAIMSRHADIAKSTGPRSSTHKNSRGLMKNLIVVVWLFGEKFFGGSPSVMGSYVWKNMLCRTFGGPVKSEFSTCLPVIWSGKGPNVFMMSGYEGPLYMSSDAGIFTSLWPSDAIWWQRSWSTLAQVMACCLTAPSHYLNQCWLIISEVQWHSY